MTWPPSIPLAHSEHAPAIGRPVARIQPKHVFVTRRQSAERTHNVDLRICTAQDEWRAVWHLLSVGRAATRIVVCVDDFLLWILDAVQAVDPVARTLIAGIAVMLETSILIGLVVPGDTIVIIASIGVEGPGQTIAMVIAVVIGSLIGESVGFWLGHWLGPRIRRSWAGQKIGEKQWERAERYLQRRGGIAIFLSRFLPVLHSLVPLTVGMSSYSYRRFLAWTAPACLIWATAYVTVTSLAAGSFRELVDKVHFAGYVFVGIIVLFLLLAFVGKKLLTRWESRHMHPTPEGEDEPPA